MLEVSKLSFITANILVIKDLRSSRSLYCISASRHKITFNDFLKYNKQKCERERE